MQDILNLSQEHMFNQWTVLKYYFDLYNKRRRLEMNKLAILLKNLDEMTIAEHVTRPIDEKRMQNSLDYSTINNFNEYVDKIDKFYIF